MNQTTWPEARWSMLRRARPRLHGCPRSADEDLLHTKYPFGLRRRLSRRCLSTSIWPEGSSRPKSREPRPRDKTAANEPSETSDVTRSPWPVACCQIFTFVLSLSGLRLCPLERASSAQDELHAMISLMARELVDRRAARHHRHSDRPRLGERLRVVNHELVLKRVGVNASDSFDQAQLRSGALKARLPIDLGRLHDQRVAFPVSARSARPLSEPAGKGRA